jgi:hypothetical protein
MTLDRREGAVGVIMINCPQTGRAISTGMKMDRPGFNRSPVFFGRTYCPHCRTNHEWFAKDAWVHEERDAVRKDAVRQ